MNFQQICVQLLKSMSLKLFPPSGYYVQINFLKRQIIQLMDKTTGGLSLGLCSGLLLGGEKRNHPRRQRSRASGVTNLEI